MPPKAAVAKARKRVAKVVQAVKAIEKSSKGKTVAQKSLHSNPAGTLKGKGGYVGDFLSAIPQVLGGLTKGGQALMGGVGSLLSGFGDYRARAAKGSYVPMAIGDGAGGGPGTFIGAAAPRIRHREYLGNIYSSVIFNSNSYPIQIGVPRMFPWLSTMADSFQQYRIHGAELYYESTSSNVSATTNTSLGTVMMSTLYEVAQPLLTNSVQVLNSEFTTSEKPTECFYHPIECDPAKTTISNLYVRGVYAPQTSFTDLGNFQISTEGMQADGVQIGKLWITYDVELMKPTLPIATNNYARFTGTNSANDVFPGVFLAGSSPIGPVATTFGGPINMTRVLSTASSTYWVNQISFPPDVPGQYMITATINSLDATHYVTLEGTPGIIGDGVTFGQPVFTSYWPSASLTPTSYNFGKNVEAIGPSSAIEDVGYIVSGLFTVIGSGGTLTLDIPLLPTATTAGLFSITWIIAQVPPSNFGVTERSELDDCKTELTSLMQRFSAMEQLISSVPRLLNPTRGRPTPSVSTDDDSDLKQTPVNVSRVEEPDTPVLARVETPSLGTSGLSSWFKGGKPFSLPLPALTVKPGPQKDLTRYGVEKNPGPVTVDSLTVEECYYITLGAANTDQPWHQLLGGFDAFHLSEEVVSAILAEKFDVVMHGVFMWKADYLYRLVSELRRVYFQECDPESDGEENSDCDVHEIVVVIPDASGQTPSAA
jgi:hypothetical protein